MINYLKYQPTEKKLLVNFQFWSEWVQNHFCLQRYKVRIGCERREDKVFPDMPSRIENFNLWVKGFIIAQMGTMCPEENYTHFIVMDSNNVITTDRFQKPLAYIRNLCPFIRRNHNILFIFIINCLRKFSFPDGYSIDNVCQK